MSTTTMTDRANALNQSTDLAQAGAVFNDATRLLDGGLWNKPADSNNQQASIGLYTTDLHAVLNDVNAALANPAGITVNGNAFTPAAQDTAVLNQVQGQLQTLLTEAPLAVGHGHAATNAQELIHTTQTTILNEINGDQALAQALGQNPYMTNTGATNVGFQNLPTGSDSAAAISAATAAGAGLSQVGAVFNAAADLAVGGLNHSNMAQFQTDMKAVATGLTNLLGNQAQLSALETAAGETGQAAAQTTIHLETLLNQTNLQLNHFDHQYASNPSVAARSTNDNLLDMIDIVQTDPALNAAAGGNGNPGATGGFAELPAYLAGTTQHFQDNQAQTNFWAQFLSEANVINNQLQNVAAGNNTTPGELQSLVSEIQNYQQFGASFAKSQGGIFGARFDNELLSGTLRADTTNAVHGLQGIAKGDTGAALAADQAQILAAGQGFAADAADVSGNNTPIGGGTYVGTATTVAGATSVAGVAQGTIPVSGAASGATGLALGPTASPATQAAQAQAGAAQADAASGQAASPHQPAPMQSVPTAAQGQGAAPAAAGASGDGGATAAGNTVTHVTAALGSNGLSDNLSGPSTAQPAAPQTPNDAHASTFVGDPALFHDILGEFQHFETTAHHYEHFWHHG